MILWQICALVHGIVRVWLWLVAQATSRRIARPSRARTTSLRIARPTREKRATLTAELLGTAQRTREFLCERAVTLPAECRAELVPPVPPALADPMPSTPPAPKEMRLKGELAIIRFHQIKDVLSPHSDRRTHVECECGWKCDVATREIAWQEYDEHVKDAIAAFHRIEKLKRMARAHRPVT